MSWYFTKMGRAGKLAEVVKQQIEDVQGCPKGTAEETAKNALGLVAETLCKSLPANQVVKIEGSGSAWNQGDGNALSQTQNFKFETLGEFVE